MTKKTAFQKNRDEILYNIINSLLAGFLVLLGSLTALNEITTRSIIIAFLTSLIVAVTQFKNYWNKEKKEYSRKHYLFAFI